MYTVYLVDDDTLILDELIETVLWEDNGFEVIGSETSPVKALDKIPEVNPDVVFCDLKMPEMDGNELIKTLKERNVDCEYVMISAYDSFENVRAFFMQAGFDYILKPVKSDEIQIVLERLVTRLSQNNNAFEADNETYNPSFNQLIEYVKLHYNEKITLDMLAKKFGFSRNYICNLFSKHLNTSLSRYITEIRMKKAKEMISDRTILLKEIALNLGYKEYYHFYKVFKDYYGYSPKDMQEMTERLDVVR